jgi:3-hydroxyisobutyrate dehydrogenase
MARNLRAKLPADDTMFVQDVNKEATSKFLQENPTGVRVADSVREVAEKSVSCFVSFGTPSSPSMMNYCSIHDLSWGLLVTLFLITENI